MAVDRRSPADIADDTCPHRDQHAPDRPRDYFGHSVWAERMLETHDQRKCKGCGLWVIWVPKGEPAARRDQRG